MSNNKKKGALIFLILGLIAIIPLASGLSSLKLLPGQQFTLDSGADETSDEEELIDDESANLTTSPLVRNVLLAFLIIFVPAGIIVAIRSPELFKEVLKRDLRLFLFFLAGIYIFRQLQLGGFFDRSESGAAAAALTIPELIQNPTVMMGFALGFLLLGAMVFSFWRLWQRFSPLLSVSQIAQEAIEEIQAGSDLRNAIVRCYYEMCRALQGVGRLERSKATTPRELARQLESAGIAGEYSHRLTRLFEKVRYGAETLGKNEEQEAIICLQAIVQAIEEKKSQRRPDFLSAAHHR
jgi:hypothetical protein